MSVYEMSHLSEHELKCNDVMVLDSVCIDRVQICSMYYLD